MNLNQGVSMWKSMCLDMPMAGSNMILSLRVSNGLMRFSKYMIKESITSETMIAGVGTRESWGKSFPISMTVTARA